MQGWRSINKRSFHAWPSSLLLPALRVLQLDGFLLALCYAPLLFGYIQGRRGHCPLPFEKEGGGAFNNNIIGHFMVYQDRLKTNLLLLFAHPEKSEWFSLISVIIFEVNIVAEQKQAYLVTIFFVFYKLPLPLDYFSAPTPNHCSGVPGYITSFDTMGGSWCNVLSNVFNPTRKSLEFKHASQ